MKKITDVCKNNRLSLVYSFVLSFLVIYGFILYCGSKDSIAALLLGITAALCLCPFVNLVVVWLIGLEPVERAAAGKPGASLGTLCFALMFILQLPTFLAFYPGIIFYDINTQIEQYETKAFSANHPLIHTFFMGFFKNLFADPNTGYAWATVVQMILADLCLAYILLYVGSKIGSYILPIITACFYGAFPLCSLLMISSTKDILFSVLLSVVFIDIYRQLTEDCSKPTLIRMIFCGIFMILMRSNAIHAMIIAALFILAVLVYKKLPCRKIAIYMLTVILVSKFAQTAMIRCLDAYPGSIKEAMSVPIQIMGRIYVTTDDPDEQKTIEKYIPDPGEYTYYISDPLKKQPEFDTLDSECKHFLLDTALLSLKHPLIAFNAFMLNTQGYWDMWHSAYQEEHHYLAREDLRGKAYIDPKLPALKDFYLAHFRYLDFSIYNPLSPFLQMGIYFHIMLFILLRSVKRRDIPMSLSLMLPAAYTLTLLFGPSAILRYGLAFIILAPVILLLSYRRSISL